MEGEGLRKEKGRRKGREEKEGERKEGREGKG